MEPPSGDTQRWIVAGLGMAAEDPYIESPHFYQINRGKRSVCLDLKSEEGMASLETLLGEADVFLSNMRYNSLKSLKLGAEELLERHPHLIVCPMTGWGMEGPESDKPVYDVAGFWARSSAASSHTPRGEYPPILVPGFGDVTTALSAVGGICAALVSRAKTGKGRALTTSLLRTGMHVNGWAMSNYFARGRTVSWGQRNRTGNPVATAYSERRAASQPLSPCRLSGGRWLPKPPVLLA